MVTDKFVPSYFMLSLIISLFALLPLFESNKYISYSIISLSNLGITYLLLLVTTCEILTCILNIKLVSLPFSSTI